MFSAQAIANALMGSPAEIRFLPQHSLQAQAWILAPVGLLRMPGDLLLGVLVQETSPHSSNRCLYFLQGVLPGQERKVASTNLLEALFPLLVVTFGVALAALLITFTAP